MTADGVLVVNPAAVADHSLLVEDNHFRRAFGAKLFGDAAAEVFQKGEGQLVRADVARHIGNAVEGVGIDGREGDAARGICAMQFGKAWGVELGQGTIAAEEDENDDRLPSFGEAPLRPVGIAQGKVRTGGGLGEEGGGEQASIHAACPDGCATMRGGSISLTLKD